MLLEPKHVARHNAGTNSVDVVQRSAVENSRTSAPKNAVTKIAAGKMPKCIFTT